MSKEEIDYREYLSQELFAKMVGAVFACLFCLFVNMFIDNDIFFYIACFWATFAIYLAFRFHHLSK